MWDWDGLGSREIAKRYWALGEQRGKVGELLCASCFEVFFTCEEWLPDAWEIAPQVRWHNL